MTGASPSPADAPRVRIDRIAAGGDGVGRLPDGRVVFVPRTAPGDLVELREIVLERNFARASLGAVVEPSPDRVTPRCVHAVRDRCGGCPLQHISHEAQLRAKAAIVGDALRRIAKLGGADVADVEIVANERPFGWRSRMTLAVTAAGRAGFRVEGDPGAVFALERCEIASPRLSALWDALRPSVAGLADGVRNLILREDAAGGLHVHAPGAADPAAWARTVASLAVPAKWSESAPSFEQVDPAMGARVRRHAVEALGDVRGVVAWDLFAGIGETSELLAAAGASVESVEADAGAVREATRRGAQSRGAAAVTRHKARVEEVVGDAAEPGRGAAKLRDPAVVIANPPRAGIDGRVLDEIARRAPRRIVYVSCDPATLARDVRRLADRYELTSVTAFDAFPQTAHVETVLALSRR